MFESSSRKKRDEAVVEVCSMHVTLLFEFCLLPFIYTLITSTKEVSPVSVHLLTGLLKSL